MGRNDISRTIGGLQFAIALSVVAAAGPCAAASVVQDISGAASSRYQFFWGQSFTTPAGTGWNHVSFNFYDLTVTPYAAGIGYMFDAAFAGTPAQLATAAALAVSAPANGSTL